MTVNNEGLVAKVIVFPLKNISLPSPDATTEQPPFVDNILALPLVRTSKHEKMWQRVKAKLILFNTGCFESMGLDKSVHFEWATETTIVLSAPSIFLEKWVKKHCMKLLMAYWSMELDDGEKLRKVQIEVRSASRTAPCHAKVRSVKAL